MKSIRIALGVLTLTMVVSANAFAQESQPCPKPAGESASALLDAASCYEQHQQSASAWSAYREAETAARKTNHPDLETTARERSAALEPTLKHLSIVVSDTSKLPGLVVTRDGVKLAPADWGARVPVDPGEHVIAASADGYISIEKKIEVKDADAAFELPLLEKLPPPPPEPGPEKLALPKGFPAPGRPLPKPHWSAMEIVGLSTASVGAAGVAVGGLMALIAASNYDAASAHCTNGTHGCDPNAVKTANEAYDLAAMATWTMVSGALVLGAGAALILLAPNDKKLARAPQAVFTW
jgi:serine/threonine-protein kinase